MQTVVWGLVVLPGMQHSQCASLHSSCNAANTAAAYTLKTQ
jgi:hypothetical protein